MKNILAILLFIPLFVDAQNVGIGTSQPDTTLHILGNKPSLKIQDTGLDAATLEFGRTLSGTYQRTGFIRTPYISSSHGNMEFRLLDSPNVGMNLDGFVSPDPNGIKSANLKLVHPNAELQSGEILSLEFVGEFLFPFSSIRHTSIGLDISARNSPVSIRAGYLSEQPHLNMFMQNQRQVMVIDTSGLDISKSDFNSMLDVNGQIEGNTLMIRNGAVNGYILTSDAAGKASWSPIEGGTRISDNDNNTKIQVEESPNDNLIRFDVDGAEVATIDQIGLQLVGPGNGVFIGELVAPNIALGQNNIGIGPSSLREINDGNNTVAVGRSALFNNRDGSNTIAIGINAARSDTASFNSVYLGYNTGNVPGIATNRTGNIMIGHNAGIGEVGSNKLYIDNFGTSAPLLYGEFDNNILRANGTFQISQNSTKYVEVDGPRISIEHSGNSVFLGQDAGLLDDLTTNENTFIGYKSGETNTGIQNAFIGAKSGQNTLAHSSNTFIGFGAGRDAASSENVLIGTAAGGGNANTTGENTMIGFQAGQFSSGSRNVLMGYQVGKSSNSSGNTMVGHQAGLAITNGGNNTMVGQQAGWSNTLGDANVMIGNLAGMFNNNSDGENTFLGSQSGQFNDGTGNTYLGYAAGVESSGSNNVFIGSGAGSLDTSSNVFLLQNSILDAPLITGDFAVDSVNIKGDLKVGDEIGSQLYVGKTLIESGGPNSLRVAAAVRPKFDNTNQLGGSSKRWTEIFAVEGVVNTSDIRAKKNVADLGYGLKDIMKLKPVRFHWNEEHESEGVHLGLIAQELNKIIPEVVEVPENEEELLGVKYADLIPVLIKSIQEQQAQIEKQQRQIDQLLKKASKGN